MKCAFIRYAHLPTLIADSDVEPLQLFDSSVTDDKAITTANVPSAALVQLALNIANMILSDGEWDTLSFMIRAWPKCCHLFETNVRVRDLA